MSQVHPWGVLETSLLNLGPGLSVLFKLMGVLETSLLNLGPGLSVLFKLMGVLKS
jgi:hypothetical protein